MRTRHKVLVPPKLVAASHITLLDLTQNGFGWHTCAHVDTCLEEVLPDATKNAAVHWKYHSKRSRGTKRLENRLEVLSVSTLEVGKRVLC